MFDGVNAGRRGTHDKIYILLYTIFTEKVPLKYHPAFKCLPDKNESL